LMTTYKVSYMRLVRVRRYIRMSRRFERYAAMDTLALFREVLGRSVAPSSYGKYLCCRHCGRPLRVGERVVSVTSTGHSVPKRWHPKCYEITFVE